MKALITRIAAAVLLAVGVSTAAAAPNILFILVDDLGWGDLGVFYQNSRNFATNRNKPAFVTPKLDALAAEGLQLRRHYCPAPVCAPSRASLLLGVHQGHANVRDNQFDKALENNHTLASVMRQAGYATVLIGKYGLQGPGTAIDQPGHPLRRGFDYFYGMLAHLSGHYHYPLENSGIDDQGQPTGVHENFTNVTAGLTKCYSTDLFTARAKQWLIHDRATNPAQPFFMYLALTAPHARLDVPTQAYPPGAGINGGLQWLGTPGAMINTANGAINSWIHPDYTNATWDNDNNAATAEVAWPAAAKRHATMIRRVDDAVSDILQTLKDLNLDTNTVVVFTSDNGPHNEAGAGGSYTQDPTFFDSFGPMDGIKRDTWEAGMRVPTWVRWPGHVPAGGTTLAVSQFQDWLPTFAELAGVPAPARTDGVSLVPTLTGIGTQRPSSIYSEYYVAGTTPNYAEFEASHRGATRNQQQVVYLDGYKGVRYNVTAATTDFRIYDTVNDPKEVTNLAGTSPYFIQLQQRMKDRVLQLRRPLPGTTRPYDSAFVPPDLVSHLVPGLDFKAYEGAFPWVPDFSTLAAVTNGSCSGIDLSVRTRGDNIGLFYTGYLSVPADGTYTFYLTTDSRAFLRLHDASLIDADFGYAGGTEISASVNLKAGRHALRLSYAHSTNGSPSLALQWSGPGIAKQPVPAANLLRYDPSVVAAPTAVDDYASTPRDTPISLNVLANDMIGSGSGPLRILELGSPLGGSVTTNLAGQVVYTPKTGFLGEDAFACTISDGLGESTATVRVRVFFADGSLWFPFNQTSGVTTDEAGGAYSASLNGYANDSAPWVAGKWNRAIQFDGAANYLTINNYTGILGSGSRTCAAWVRTTSTGQLPVISWGPNSTGNKWTFLLQNGHVRSEITSGYLEGTRLVNDGQWHHVACSFTNDALSITNARLYVDGTLETNFTAALSRDVNTTSSGDVKIGGDVQGRLFLGTLDEVRLYNRALTSAEIKELYTGANQSAAAWHRAYFGDAAVDWQAVSALGYPRLLDYALGAQPYFSDAAARNLRAEIMSNRLAVHYPRRIAGTSELLYTLELSRDLKNWGGLDASLIGTAPAANKPGFEEAVFQTDATLDQEVAQFVRLAVALP